MSVNDAAPVELDLNRSTFSDPVPRVLQVQLHEGTNTISIGNPTGYAPIWTVSWSLRSSRRGLRQNGRGK